MFNQKMLENTKKLPWFKNKIFLRKFLPIITPQLMYTFSK